MSSEEMVSLRGQSRRSQKRSDPATPGMNAVVALGAPFVGRPPTSPRISDPSDFSNLIEALYAAASDDTKWTVFLEALRVAFSCSSAHVTAQEPSGRPGRRVSVGYEPDDDRRYFDQHATRNPLFQRAMSAGVGQLLLSHKAFPTYDLERLPYYHEWLKPRDQFFCLGIVLTSNEREVHWLSINRSKETEAFNGHDTRLVEALVPHLQRAAHISSRLSTITAAKNTAESLLQVMDQPIVPLDENGRVVFLNPSASRVLDLTNGVGVANGLLCGTMSGVTAAMRGLVAGAVRNIDGQGCRGGTMSVPRRAPLAPLIATIVPLPSSADWRVPGAPAVAVLFSDPSKARRAPEEVLRTAFGLTPAEARLAVLLADGRPLSSAAETLRIGRETARTHLAHVFAKTGTNRQVDMVRLVLSAHPILAAAESRFT